MTKLKFFESNNDNLRVHNTPWKVVISDDDEGVHSLTKIVLKDFEYKNKKIEFISAYSGSQTIDILKESNNIALVLLDVVMETDDAGLVTAKKIREELDNQAIQIILRTGQPGTAPETDVVINFAINDYKEKTELTSQKLITSIVTALRSYENIRALEKNKHGLNEIIKTTDTIFTRSNSDKFNTTILYQIISLLKLSHHPDVKHKFNGISFESNGGNFRMLDSIGSFSNVKSFIQLDEDVKASINQVISEKQSVMKNNIYIGFIDLGNNVYNIFYVSGCESIDEIDRSLIDIFFRHSSIALKNLYLHQEMFTTQKSLVEMLGDVIETRYHDAPRHVKRVAETSYLLAIKSGMSEEEARIFRLVSPMHDIGKIGISDAILMKKGKLTDEEFTIMKEHTTIGYDILKSLSGNSLHVAALVAYEHHEKWDGTGYPQGLKGNEISIYGRITSIADIFDALANKRCYKDAWSLEQITGYFQDNNGTTFDPSLLKIFFDNIDDVLQIQIDYSSTAVE